VSSRKYSLALDSEHITLQQQELEGFGSVLIQQRYTSIDSSLHAETTSHDVVEFGGTITISF